MKPILVWPHPCLREKCSPVRTRQRGRAIARRLTETLLEYNRRAEQKAQYESRVRGFVPTRFSQKGIGLAAPQIGIGERVFVLLLDEEKPPLVLINPEVVDYCRHRVRVSEGCISLPGQEYNTWRAPWVKMAFEGELNPMLFGEQNPERWTPGRLLPSVAAQHELAHLSGILAGDCQAPDYPGFNCWGEWAPGEIQRG